MLEKAQSSVPRESMSEPFSLKEDERSEVIGRGIMRLHGQTDEKIIPITPANEIFFFTRPNSDIRELTYQGSGLVASLLRGQRDFELDRPADKLQPLAFFDAEGTFYDRYVLTDFVEEMIQTTGISKIHHATFESIEQTSSRSLHMEIDEIRCISAAIKT